MKPIFELNFRNNKHMEYDISAINKISDFKVHNSKINCNDKKAIIVNDLNCQLKVIPKFIKERYKEENNQYVMISFILNRIFNNAMAGCDTSILWNFLNKMHFYNNNVKNIFDNLFKNYCFWKKQGYSCGQTIKKITNDFDFFTNFIYEKEDFNDKKIFKSQNRIRDEFMQGFKQHKILENYSICLNIPGVNQLEKEYVKDVKNTFPKKMYEHLSSIEDFDFKNIENNGYYTLQSKDGTNRQLNFIDKKFQMELLDLSGYYNGGFTLVDDFKDFDLLYDHLHNFYLFYVLYVQNEILNFALSYKKNKNTPITSNSFVSLFLTDFIKNNSFITSNKHGLISKTYKMEGFHPDCKNIIVKPTYINTIFDFCSLFINMFFSLNLEFNKNYQMVFVTFDNFIVLPFSLYDFKYSEKNSDFSIIPKSEFKASIFNENNNNNYAELFFKKNKNENILEMIENIENIELFLETYLKEFNIPNINDFIKNFLSQKHVTTQINLIKKYSQYFKDTGRVPVGKRSLKRLDILHSENILFYLMTDLTKLYKDKNIGLIDELELFK